MSSPFKKILIASCSIAGALILLAVAEYFFFPQKFPAIILPKLPYEEHQARCSAHTDDVSCKADPYCYAIEVTPVCVNGKDGQVCLNGGYQCYHDSKYTEDRTIVPKTECNQRMDQDTCQTTTDCKWEEQPGGAKCIVVSQERQDME